MIRVVATPTGPRVYLGPYRLHHGLAGAALTALGVAMCLHDWADRWWPTRDRNTDQET